METKQLEGWTPVTEAAAELGISRQGLHYRILRGQIPETAVREVRTGGKKIILIRNDAIDDMKENS